MRQYLKSHPDCKYTEASTLEALNDPSLVTEILKPNPTVVSRKPSVRPAVTRRSERLKKKVKYGSSSSS